MAAATARIKIITAALGGGGFRGAKGPRKKLFRCTAEYIIIYIICERSDIIVVENVLKRYVTAARYTATTHKTRCTVPGGPEAACTECFQRSRFSDPIMMLC